MNKLNETLSVEQVKEIVTDDEIQQVLNSEIARTRLLAVNPYMSEADIQLYSARSDNPWDVDIIYLMMQLKQQDSTTDVDLIDKNT